MKKKAIIVISSHVARGSVGNRAAVFALEILSHPVWAVPTIMLPWHPGHGPATRISPSTEEFEKFLSDLAKAPWLDEVGAVLSGYMANPSQPKQVAELVLTLKSKNPDLIYMCDPVIGDNKSLYVQEETAIAIRDELLPISDITTPNRFELGWLGDNKPLDTLKLVSAAASALGPDTVLVTSCPGKTNETTGNLLYSASELLSVTHPSLANPPNGPGDLTAAIFLGHKLDGLTNSKNLERTTASVLEILSHSNARGSDELMLETDAQSILSPAEPMQAETL